jgi:predicted HTH domain antitoxin
MVILFALNILIISVYYNGRLNNGMFPLVFICYYFLNTDIISDSCKKFNMTNPNIMKTLTVDIPDSLDLTEHDLKMLLAGNLYEQGKLTLGEAAQLAGLTKRAFIEIVGKYGFSVASNSLDDLHSDIENA